MSIILYILKNVFSNISIDSCPISFVFRPWLILLLNFKKNWFWIKCSRGFNKTDAKCEKGKKKRKKKENNQKQKNGGVMTHNKIFQNFPPPSPPFWHLSWLKVKMSPHWDWRLSVVIGINNVIAVLWFSSDMN